MDQPLVTVVMGVHDGVDTIARTVASVLDQEGICLQMVVVDDGSTDGTSDVLAGMARHDERLTVLSRPHRGLTASLEEGCRLARGDFIARQDAGDSSLPGRLRKQAQCLSEHPGACLCSTHVRCVVPEGDTIEIRSVDPERLARGLCGPAHHGSVMMRRRAYEEAGGYRTAFYYAQDLDLWSRMEQHGEHRVVPEVLYEASVSPGSISGSRRREQERFLRIIRGATAARLGGGSETPWLRQAETLSERCRQARRSRRRQAQGAYFIASCLASGNPELALRYLDRCLALDPWHLRARLKRLRWR
jgi:glycosyltransferase involved in cell wall biosynthesis